MKTYRFNNEYWYCDKRSLFKRIRQWIIWFGGWELTNGKGWRFRLDKKLWMEPWPLSLFGHKITFFGDWLQINVGKKRWFTMSWRKTAEHPYAYMSTDGTPSEAYHWFWGAPSYIVELTHEKTKIYQHDGGLGV